MNKIRNRIRISSKVRLSSRIRMGSRECPGSEVRMDCRADIRLLLTSSTKKKKNRSKYPNTC